MKHLRERILAFCMALCLCLSLCAVPASAAVTMPESVGEAANITLSLSLTKSGGNYTATYTATTNMIEWLANAAAFCKDDPRMKDFRFTCTLTDELTARPELGEVTSGDYTFTSAEYDGKKIFVFDTAMVSDGSIVLRYKLNTDVLDAWKTATAETVKENLQQTMKMTASKTVSANIVEAVKDELTTHGTEAKIEIISTSGSLPFYHEPRYDKIVILAAHGKCYPEFHTGGGTGDDDDNDTRKPTIDIKDITPAIPAAGGKTTVDKPGAKPGETVKIITEPDRLSMVDHITITDEDGNRVSLSYDGEGVYEFKMPEKGTVEIDVKYRVIPADPGETGVSEVLDTDDHRLYMIGDTVGNFNPNASIKRSEVATAFFRLLRNQDIARTLHFDDVKATNWYAQPVEVLAALGLVEGMGNGDYEPNRPITRAEFAMIASRFTKKHYSGVVFTDVREGAWYADAVSTAAHFGWIYGMGDGTFEPNRPITRTEAAAIINRMLMRISDWIDVDAGHGRHFPDVSDTFWGRYEISEATNDHDHTLEEKYYYEDWYGEEWRQTVDNDPVNFGQPKF